MLAAIAIPVGLLIGLSLGALGGGGSILTVPALVYLLRQPPHAATTGSLIIVGITALAGAALHWRSGRVRAAAGITFGVVGVAGSYAGTRLSASISPDLLLSLFAGLMLTAAAVMLRRRRRRPPAADFVPGARPSPPAGRPALPDPMRTISAGRGIGTKAVTLDKPGHAAPAPAPAPARAGAAPPRLLYNSPAIRRGLKVALAATIVGMITGFFGVGGGFVIVPALVLALGFDMPTAVGTSLLVISINSAAALAARLGSGIHLDWPIIVIFSLAALAGALTGTRVASRVSPARLSTAFTILLIAVAAYTLARSLPALL